VAHERRIFLEAPYNQFRRVVRYSLIGLIPGDIVLYIVTRNNKRAGGLTGEAVVGYCFHDNFSIVLNVFGETSALDGQTTVINRDERYFRERSRLGVGD
jgi:hypothetical protein